MTVYSTIADVREAREPNLGRPLPGVIARIVDTAGQRQPVGVPGELWLAGPQVARGYLGQAALTAERFGTDPWSADSGTRLYRTGDRVRLTRFGRIEYLGRFDDQIKLRGHRIELGEIDAAFRALPGISDAAAVVVGDDVQKDLAVHVVVEPGGNVDAAQLRASLRDVLPPAMLPRWIVPAESIPTLPNGKLDRGALARVDLAGHDTSPTQVALANPAQELVASIWHDVLGVSAISPDDDFFDIGGDSLRAITALSRLRELDIDLKVTAMFDRPTLARVSELVLDQLLGAADES